MGPKPSHKESKAAGRTSRDGSLNSTNYSRRMMEAMATGTSNSNPQSRTGLMHGWYNNQSCLSIPGPAHTQLSKRIHRPELIKFKGSSRWEGDQNRGTVTPIKTQTPTYGRDNDKDLRITMVYETHQMHATKTKTIPQDLSKMLLEEHPGQHEKQPAVQWATASN